MERATTPARDPHASTADLLSWPEAPAADSAFTVSANTTRYNARTHQPIDGISKTLYGGQINQEESDSLHHRRPCSGYKQKDNTGSKIFSAAGEDSAPDYASRRPCSGYKQKDNTGSKIFSAAGEDSAPDYASDFYSSNRTAVRMVQQATNGISQISFNTEEDVSTKKPNTLPAGGTIGDPYCTDINAEEEVSPKKPITHAAGARQRELSGTLPYCTNKVHFSDAKCQELVGHDIFGPPSEVPHRSTAHALDSNTVTEEPPAPRNVHTSVRVSNPAGGQSNIMFSEEPVTKTPKKIHDQKFVELTGNDIFKGDVPPGSTEKPLRSLKQREMSGSNIFSDGKTAFKDSQRGTRQAPGGDSSLILN